MSFTLDAKKAAQADATDKITEAGAYIGVITQAWEEVAKSGAVALKLNFKRDDGAEAKHLAIWHTSANGEKNFNEDKVHALMYAMQLRSCSKVQGKIKRYDFDLKKEVEATANIFPEFLNKKVGLCLGAEEYEGKIKLALDCSFDFSTKLTAAEAIGKKPAQTVERMIVKYSKPIVRKSSGGDDKSPQPPIDFYDDIPF